MQQPEVSIKTDDRVQQMIYHCVERLDNESINEILGGYENDINKFYKDLNKECYTLLYNGRRLESETCYDALTHVNDSIEETFRVLDMGYFVNAVFGSEVMMNWHHLEWIKLANKEKFVAILASRDHGKSFFWTQLHSCWMMYGYDAKEPSTKMKRRGFLFSNNDSKAAYFLGEIKQMIMGSEILRDRLFSNNRLFKTDQIIAKNGAVLDTKGFLGSARGYHPDWIVVDDPLTDQSIYSPTYRERCIEYFYGVVLQMLVPNGKLVLVGTPFHAQDIYSTFREPSKLLKWIYREYPAIFPDGRVLWSDRYPLSSLKEKRLTLGSQIFGREFLLKPVTSDTSMFPWKMISPAIAGMEKYRLVNNIEAFPIRFKKVVVGCDFAKSANVGSDATWFTIWGITENEEMWLLHSWRKVGATFGQQISKIKSIGTEFRPDIYVLEANNFQKIYTEFLEDTGLPIVPHHTGTNKANIEDGVPSLAVMFERRKIKLPYGDENSKNTADLLLSEFASMSYTEKGIQGVGGHDDGVMSTWFGSKGMRYQGGGFSYDFI